MTTPLKGIRVLDLGIVIAGPFTGSLLVDLGADVIKVERPQTGDPIRLVGAASRDGLNCSPEGEGVSTAVSPCFLYLNSSKKSLTLDLKTSQGRKYPPQNLTKHNTFTAFREVNPGVHFHE